jgi:hypothetical protein
MDSTLTPEAALLKILQIAAKYEVQYWLDEPGTDAEKLGRIVAICRDTLFEMRNGTYHA